ncbi:hypothetical protein GLAREA_12232 [Glarea lozoyensis ATCC 20868]|uniref:Uncharacterized protein n=1 Tax=Glarea lozoyensis (strain ATCC 20868 / MF5171) TaxID=1116229 RepID=S3DHG7_GLAL2|nr:uncharacterized protein GLAREA_12232 [Glarea lozoyensis ATCC 20868]EPE31476.1 hypothetical protein GLAREA_12232 [Glarea lozoyensis ATCC 20868]
MDPVTILGAVGSVVGIAAFGLQLLTFLDTFVSTYADQGVDLERILESVAETRKALESVQDLLLEERANLATYKKYMIFSEEALRKVEITAHRRQNLEDILRDPYLRKEIAGMAKQLNLTMVKPSPPDHLALPPDPPNLRKETIVGSRSKTSKSNKSNASRSAAGKSPSSSRRRKDTKDSSSHRRRRLQSQDSLLAGNPSISRGRTPEPNQIFSGFSDRQDYHPKSRHKKTRPLATKESDMSSEDLEHPPKFVEQVKAAQEMIARTKSEGKRAAKASKFTVIGNPETILPKGETSRTTHVFPDIPMSQSPPPWLEKDTQSVAPESKSQHYGPIVTSTKENADSVPTPSRPSHAVKFATTYQRPSVTEPLESSTKENQESAPNHKAHDLDRKFDGEAEEPFDCHTPVAVEPVKTFQDPSLEARTMVLPDTPLARILPHHEQDIDSSSLPIPTITREPPEKLGHSSINTLTPSLVQYVPTKPSGIYLTRPLKPPTASIFNTSAGLNIEKELLTFADINGRTLESKDIEIPIVLPPIALDRAQVPLRKGEPPVDENSLTLIPSQDTKTRENSEAEDSDANSFVTASAYWTPLEDLAKELDIDKLVEKVEALAIDAQEYPDELPEPVLIDPKPHSMSSTREIDS